MLFLCLLSVLQCSQLETSPFLFKMPLPIKKMHIFGTGGTFHPGLSLVFMSDESTRDVVSVKGHKHKEKKKFCSCTCAFASLFSLQNKNSDLLLCLCLWLHHPWKPSWTQKYQHLKRKRMATAFYLHCNFFDRDNVKATLQAGMSRLVRQWSCGESWFLSTVLRFLQPVASNFQTEITAKLMI